MARTNRAELLQAVQQADAGLSTRAFIEQSTCYVFSDGWCATFNDEVCCRAKTKLPREFKGAVKAAKFKSVLEALSDDEVDLEAREGVLAVRAHRMKAELRMQREILLPVEQVDAPGSWEDLPEDFARALEQVIPAAGTNQDEFISTCVHLNPKYVEACDRTQATRYEIDLPIQKPFLVRAKSLSHVAPLGVTRMGETPNWVHFRNKTAVISIRRHLDTYPPIGKLMDFKGAPAVLPRGAIQAAKLGSVFTSDDRENDKVLVRLRDGAMKIVGEGAEGRSEVDLDTTYKGEEVRFRVAPALLSKIVSTHTDCEILKNKLRVTGDRWTYMVLLNVAEEAPAPAAGDPAEEEVEEGAAA